LIFRFWSFFPVDFSESFDGLKLALFFAQKEKNKKIKKYITAENRIFLSAA
jgi:hypothetical protein